jgi:hypothetical protein
MIVATVLTPQELTAAIEPAVTEFLNSRTVLNWAETALAVVIVI